MITRLKCLILIASLSIFLLGGECICGQDEQLRSSDCVKWWSKVISDLEGGVLLLNPTPPDDEIIQAIDCLLQLEGDKRKARFGGVTSIQVSQMMPMASVELAALFYISYLYRGQWDHADGIGLWDRNGAINPPGSIETAYISYRKWFDKVKKIGLNTAREEKLNPLEGTGLHWYGK